jgi:transposase
MSYAGATPREYSSGDKVWRGAVMKTGSSILRWIFVECAQSCRLTPRIIKDLAKRSEGLSPEVKAIAWKAQIRLHRKYVKLVSRGRSHSVAVMAVAREFMGFVWAVAQQVNLATTSGYKAA